MFGEESDIPIIEVSMDGSLDPEKEWKIGQTMKALRYGFIHSFPQYNTDLVAP